jgi:hypothetical protein
VDLIPETWIYFSGLVDLFNRTAGSFQPKYTHHRFQITAFPLLLHFELEIEHGWMLEKENRECGFERI